jgi:hypothetical protein
VDDTFRVRARQRLARLEGIFERDLRRQAPFFGEHAGEIAPLEPLHHDEGHAVRQRADVEDAGHVLALDPHGESGLAREARDEIVVGRELGAQELQRDFVAELGAQRRHDVADVADADELANLVFSSDDLSRHKGHREGFLLRRRLWRLAGHSSTLVIGSERKWTRMPLQP